MSQKPPIAQSPQTVPQALTSDSERPAFEQEVTADLPAANQFLAPRLFMNNGATAAAVALDCSGGYVETDY
jgi:hypothetical protein